MTTVLRKFFKKFFNVDLDGNSAKTILANAIENINTTPSSGGVGVPRIGYNEETGMPYWIGETYTSLELKEVPVIYLEYDGVIVSTRQLIGGYMDDKYVIADEGTDLIIDEDGNIITTAPEGHA